MADTQLVSRKQAKELGLKYYFTGKPCNRGGIAKRRVSDFRCLCDLCKIADVDRARTHWWANRERMIAKAKKWRAENPDKYRRSVKNWHAEHIERSKSARKEWERRNRESLRANQERYRRANLSKVSARQASRRAVKVGASVQWMEELTDLVVKEAASLSSLRGIASGFEWSVDHMIPLRARRVSGLHVWNNLQVIPARINSSKKNKLLLCDPGQWIAFC